MSARVLLNLLYKIKWETVQALYHAHCLIKCIICMKNHIKVITSYHLIINLM